MANKFFFNCASRGIESQRKNLGDEKRDEAKGLSSPSWWSFMTALAPTNPELYDPQIHTRAICRPIIIFHTVALS